MKKTITRFAVFLCLLAAFAVEGWGQIQQWPSPQGLTAFKVNGALVASQFDFQITERNAPTFGAWTNMPSGCIMNLGGGVRTNPFSTGPTGLFNTTVTVTDLSTPANTETVAVTAMTTAPPNCSLTATVLNAHTGKYIVSSGTCGLREALNFLGTSAGTVRVTQEFFDHGCKASTITGMTGTFLAKQQIFDEVNNLWYTLQPTTLSALAVPTASNNLTCTSVAGLVCQSATVGGTWPNSAEVAGSIYVDSLGGWSVASVTHTLTPSASGTNILQFNPPAASTGAVGWLPWAGLTYNSASYVLPVDQVNVTCTPSALFTGYPVCAMGATATVLGPIVTTSLIPQSGGIAAAYNPNAQSHTTFGYRQSRAPSAGFQQTYGPFTACPTLTAGQLCILGTVQLPTGLLQNMGIGGVLHFSGDVTLTPSTGGSVGIDTEIGDITDFTTGTPKIVCTEGETTATGTAAIKLHFDCTWTVNALGTTGSIMPGGFFMEQLQAGTTTGNLGVESGTAAITADVLDQDSIYFVFLQASAAESATPPQLMNLKIEILNP